MLFSLQDSARYRLRLFVCAAVTLFPSAAWPQGYAPDVAAGKMTVPTGFAVTLVAAEPEVRQPVAIDFDDRGRLWVMQYLQYPNPAGLQRVRVDRFSRTKYDRVPEPPPRGPRGDDRLTILDNPDATGRLRWAKDFVGGLNLASAFAFGHGGVFVLQAPYLLYYPDRNDDDVPDGDPDVLLTGFGMEDAHSVANSLTWGPDGWLYGCQGSTVTANIRGIEFQQGVWRYHPITHKFELFCEGGANSWGLDFDAAGELLYSTNVGGHVMLHGVQGGYYWKSFGKHGALHNPFTYGYFDHVPHEGFRGGHVTVGGVVYQGASFPAPFRGKYIAADLLGHSVYWHDLSSQGSTFHSRHGGVLLQANDTWFAPSDVTVGPDGAAYVADWHDKRTAHPDPDAEWDRSNGRVYRIAADGTKPYSGGDLKKRSSAELVALLGSHEGWLVSRARRILAERRDPEVILPLRTLVFESRDGQLALEALWALYVTGGFSDGFAAKVLRHDNADIRRWTVRLVGDEERVAPEIARQLRELAATEPDIRVCCQLACAAKRLPADDALPVIWGLASRDLPDDPLLPNLLWWTLERHCVVAREQAVDFLTTTAALKMPLARRLAPLMIRRYATEASAAGDAACLRLLRAAPAAAQLVLLAAMNQGWKERSGQAKVSPELRDALIAHWTERPDDLIVLELMLRLGHAPAEQRLLARLDNKTSRAAAAQLLGEIGSPACVPALLKLADDTSALKALRRFDDPAIAATILGEWPRLAGAARAAALETLTARRTSARALLTAVDAGRISAADVPVDQVRPLAGFHDAHLDALVRKHWGSLRAATPEEKLAEVRRLNNDLRAADGDAKGGRDIFRKNCANCHQLFGEGEKIGPDLTHANRKDRDYLLVSIVDPSAVIRKEYVAHLVHMTDGRSVTGLIVEQTGGRVTLATAKNERISIERGRIESMEESPVSLMPEDLLKPLKPQELRDLFRYLQSDRAP